MFIATLIAETGLDDILLSDVAHEFTTDCIAGSLRRVDWIDRGRAADLVFEPADGFDEMDCAELAAAMRDRALSIAEGGLKRTVPLDIIVQAAATRGTQKLLVADMDSTMITVECIDELADYAGIKDEVAAVTEAAMRGELDFAAALDARVALLRDLDEAIITRCYTERVRIMPGAHELVRTFRARGGRAVLVSGGFTVFADRVAAEIGFDRVVSNRLDIVEGHLAGTVARPIVGAATKRAVLEEERAALGLDPAQVIAIGDGANDIPMIRAAGLGIAYHAKPRTAAAAAARIEHGDLTAVLHVMGIPKTEWLAG